uniref:Putative conserved secreted protein n=1 Tax=Rhipicephalus microplus TaxID=6941 RepID=A0A6G5A038_RHIMP
MVFVSAMAPIKSLFTCLLTVVSLPQLKAWAPSDINCRRLVPLQLTSVVTPCVYPCILLSPYNGHGEIVLRHEVDGTPCKIPGSESFTLQISKCVRGLCQLLHDELHLKRTKRETRLIRKRRSLVDKVKKKMGRRKKKRKKKKGKKKTDKNIKHE